MQFERFRQPDNGEVREKQMCYFKGNNEDLPLPTDIPEAWYFPGGTIVDLPGIACLPELIEQVGVVHVPVALLDSLQPQVGVEYIPALTGEELPGHLALTTRKTAHEQGIAHPAVHVIILNNNAEVLVLARQDATNGLPLYNFPCGHVGIESLWEAMLREVAEETSGVVKQLNYLGFGATHCRWSNKISPDGGIQENREVVFMGVFNANIDVVDINRSIRQDPNAEACEARLVSNANLLAMMNGQDPNARFLRHGSVFRQQFLELFRLGVQNMC